MRILCYLSDLPCPPNTGGRQRGYLQLKALRELGDLRVVVVTSGDVSADELALSNSTFGPTSALRPRKPGTVFPWGLVRWANPGLVDRLVLALDPRPMSLLPDPALAAQAEAIAREFQPDVTWTRYYLTAASARTWRSGPGVLDLDDVDPAYVREVLHDPASKLWRRLVMRSRLWTLGRRFKPDLARFGVLTFVSPNDKPWVEARPNVLVPNVPFFDTGEIPPAPAPAGDSREVLAVATWGYTPNALGMDRFVRSVWPGVREACPEAVLNIVGGGIRPQYKDAWATTPGVKLSGFVKDLREQYARAALVVAPVYQGGGTKIKVIEALAYGRAVVATEHAQHGYEGDLLHDRSLLVARDDAEFARHVAALLADPARRDRLAASGHGVVRERLSPGVVRARVHEAVRLAMGR